MKVENRAKVAATGLILGGMTLLFGCSSNYNQPPPKKLPPNPHAVKIKRVWSHNVGGGGGRQLLGLAAGVEIGQGGPEVFAASTHGHVAAFDAATGKRLWSHHVKKGRLSGGPVAGDGLVVVGTRLGDAIALDASDGKLKWKQYVGAPVIAAPAIGTSIVAVKTIAGTLVGLSPKTGAVVWQTSEAQPSLTLRFGIEPLIVNGVVYGGFADGNVIAVDAATGKEQWHRQVGQPSGNNPVANLVNVGGVMDFVGGDLYVATYQSRLAALDGNSGQVLWSRKLSTYTGVGLDGAHVYVSDAAGAVHAYDLVTGVPDWTDSALGYRRLSIPVPFGKLVAVGDRFGWLHFLDRDNGHYLGRVKVGGGAIRMPPVVAGDYLIVLDDDGTLAAYTLPASNAKPEPKP
ncbi:MAG: outer membrane protein assembly factor BamB [Gammaproteobacteria bacterium]